MKRIVYLMATISLLTSCNDVPKQTPLTMTDEIVLTAPDTQSGLTVNEALALRQSCRDYSSEELSLEEVSEVLWAASGINRADGKQTALRRWRSIRFRCMFSLPKAPIATNRRHTHLSKWPMATTDKQPPCRILPTQHR